MHTMLVGVKAPEPHAVVPSRLEPLCAIILVLSEESLKSGSGLDTAAQLWSLLAALCTLGAAGHANQSIPQTLYASLARTLAACSPSQAKPGSSHSAAGAAQAQAVLPTVLTAAPVVLRTLLRHGLCMPSFADAAGLVHALARTLPLPAAGAAQQPGPDAAVHDLGWLQAAHAVLDAASSALDPGNAVLKVEPSRLQATLHFLLRLGFHPSLGLEPQSLGLASARASARGGAAAGASSLSSAGAAAGLARGAHAGQVQVGAAALHAVALAARAFLVKLLTSCRGDKLPSVSRSAARHQGMHAWPRRAARRVFPLCQRAAE